MLKHFQSSANFFQRDQDCLSGLSHGLLICPQSWITIAYLHSVMDYDCLSALNYIQISTQLYPNQSPMWL